MTSEMYNRPTEQAITPDFSPCLLLIYTRMRARIREYLITYLHNPAAVRTSVSYRTEKTNPASPGSA